MSRSRETFATLRADLRQRLQLLRARIERARERPYRRPRVTPKVERSVSWEESSAWAGDDAGVPPTNPSTPHDGLLSRPRTVRDATERLRSSRSLIRRQRTRRAL